MNYSQPHPSPAIIEFSQERNKYPNLVPLLRNLSSIKGGTMSLEAEELLHLIDTSPHLRAQKQMLADVLKENIRLKEGFQLASRLVPLLEEFISSK